MAAQLMGVGSLSAQNANKADGLFQAANYTAAQKEYGLLLKSNPNSALYLYRYARCAQELGDYWTAVKYFEKSGNRYDLKHYNLGEIYLHLGYPDEAIEAYTQYLKTLKADSERLPYILAQIHQAEKLQRYMRRVEKVQIIDSVEIPLSELLSAYPLSAETGTLTKDSQGQLVYTNQRNDRKLWAAANDDKQLIVSSRNLMNTWTAPDTLPHTINMSADQNYPYLLSDGVTLYFASKDTSGLGGYDIYVSRYNTYTETYTHPENIGLPYNSPANDYLMVVDEIHHRGYFATDRHSREGYVHVYTFVPTSEKAYWRNVPQDSLVAYAQLRSGLHVEEEIAKVEIANKPSVPQPTVQVEREKEDIYFVLNDSVIYTSKSEFRSSTAQKTYQEWQNMQKQLEIDQESLEQLRWQYANADDAGKKELTPQILQLEKKQSQLHEQCNELLQSTRKTESEAVQQ
jgi:tetratricopeptide (TPR) repeat protein